VIVTSPQSAVRLVQVPYDSGHRGRRMGVGPLALTPGVVARLEQSGHRVEQQVVEATSPWSAELQTTFELHAGVAAAVAASRDAGELPVVLAGGCNATVGVLAGLGTAARRVGVLWLDGHGDFNTPDEDPTGFLDGQGLAMVVGRCWRAATARLPGFAPVPEEDVILLGARDLTDEQGPCLLRRRRRPDRRRGAAGGAARRGPTAGRLRDGGVVRPGPRSARPAPDRGPRPGRPLGGAGDDCLRPDGAARRDCGRVVLTDGGRR
jgi:arginase